MRPLYLSIKGFGPFIKGEIPEEIFRLIHQERFFLITGEIGAGKTTLFDAIFFALFGEATFPDRSPKDLISHHLYKYPHIEPEVVLKFLFKGQIYQILRKPPYEKRQNYVSALWINDRLYSQKKEEIAEKLKEIFGLEGKYFKKVFMLPQGEYRELLLSEPRERKALIEKLFDMDLLSRLENFFKERVNKLSQHLRNLEDTMKKILNLGEVNSLEELDLKINTLSLEMELLEKDFSTITNNLKSLEKELKEVEYALDLLNQYHKTKIELSHLEINKISEIETLKEKLEKLKILNSKVYYYENTKTLWVKLKEKNTYKKNLLKDLEKIKLTLSSKKLKEKEIKEKETLYQQKKEELLKKREILEILTNINSLTKELQIIEKLYQEQYNQLKILEKKEEEILQEKEKIKQIKNEIKEKEEIKKKIIEIEEKIKYLKDFDEKKRNLEIFEKEIEDLENRKISYERDLERYEWERFACILAENLKEGTPCPVCGSLHHPKKASPTLFTSSVENLKEKLTYLENKLEERKREYSHLQGELSLLKSLIPENREEIFLQMGELKTRLSFLEGREELKISLDMAEKMEKDIEERYQKFLEEKREAQEALKNLGEKRARLEGELSAFRTFSFSLDIDSENLKREIFSLEKEIRDYELEKETLERELSTLERDSSYIKGQLNNLEEELRSIVKDYRESLREVSKLVKKGIFKNFKELKRYYSELSRIEDYEREVQSFESERNRLMTNLKELHESLISLNLKGEEKELRELESKYANLINAKSELEKKRDESLSKLSSIGEKLKTLEHLKLQYLQISQEKETLEGEFPYLEKINLLISGKVSGISFHSFVLSKFLSLILKRANHYLNDFTFGRYRFVEGELFTRKFILEVFDAYTGREREVNTLSGGESFLASLAFALGTSDVVVSLSKKNPLETLLIDEGFGTLDENTLEKVLQAIFQLSQKTGKIIGVISHIRELKEYFPILIEVIKQKDGESKIQINKRSL